VLPAKVRQAARRAALRDVVPAVWNALGARENAPATTQITELQLS
jgi:hypothetical protein